jgi:dihydroorotate dehydrogenase (fumarate)
MGDNASDKPYMVSISGKTVKDNLQMMEKVEVALGQGAKIAALELNLACPNVIGKPIIAYDFAQLETVLKEVCGMPLFKKIPLGLKLPPYLDGPHFEQAANIINQHKDVVKYCASINTFGNAFAVDPVAEMPVISSNGGFAGLSGPAVKFTALANVTKMRKLLDPAIDVVGVGGIESGQDAFDMILCGASAVQVGTCHWNEGPSCFDRICNELADIMQQKGYTSIDDFKGKLKPWSKEGAAVSRESRKGNTIISSSSTAKSQSASTTNDLYMYVNIIFAAVIAFLLADKYGFV